MRKIISVILAITFAVGMWSGSVAESSETAVPYSEPGDPEYLASVEDAVYLSLIESLDSEEYCIENVQAVYISQEYLEELAFNSRANIYFGFTLTEIEEIFQGRQYVFTLDENNLTTVKEFEEYHDDTLERIIRNVAIGTGVILVCVTVSVVSAGAGAPAACMIFAYAADGAIVGAVAGAKFGALSGGIVKLIETGDVTDALEAAAVSASEGYKWGAITGAVVGGTSETISLVKATKSGLTMNEVALIQMESRYSLDFVRTVRSMDEYNVYRNADLLEYRIGDERVLLPRDFNFDYVDPATGFTNRQLMANGYNPFDPSGVKYEWHHVGQHSDSPLALLTRTQHQTYDAILHDKSITTEVHGVNENQWKKIKELVNEATATLLI